MIYIKFHSILKDHSSLSNTFSFNNNYFIFTNIYHLDHLNHHYDYYETIHHDTLIQIFNFFETFNSCFFSFKSIDNSNFNIDFDKFIYDMRHFTIPHSEFISSWLNLKLPYDFNSLLSRFIVGSNFDDIHSNSQLLTYYGNPQSLIDYFISHDKFFLLNSFLILSKNDLKINDIFLQFIFSDNLPKLMKLFSCFPIYRFSILKYPSFTRLFDKDDILPLLCYISNHDIIPFNNLLYMLIVSDKIQLTEELINEIKKPIDDIFEIIIIDLINNTIKFDLDLKITNPSKVIIKLIKTLSNVNKLLYKLINDTNPISQVFSQYIINNYSIDYNIILEFLVKSLHFSKIEILLNKHFHLLDPSKIISNFKMILGFLIINDPLTNPLSNLEQYNKCFHIYKLFYSKIQFTEFHKYLRYMAKYGNLHTLNLIIHDDDFNPSFIDLSLLISLSKCPVHFDILNPLFIELINKINIKSILCDDLYIILEFLIKNKNYELIQFIKSHRDDLFIYKLCHLIPSYDEKLSKLIVNEFLISDD